MSMSLGKSILYEAKKKKNIREPLCEPKILKSRPQLYTELLGKNYNFYYFHYHIFFLPFNRKYKKECIPNFIFAVSI